MIDFQEELEKFQPSREVGDMEDVMVSEEATDITEIILEMTEKK